MSNQELTNNEIIIVLTRSTDFSHQSSVDENCELTRSKDIATNIDRWIYRQYISV